MDGEDAENTAAETGPPNEIDGQVAATFRSFVILSALTEKQVADRVLHAFAPFMDIHAFVYLIYLFL